MEKMGTLSFTSLLHLSFIFLFCLHNKPTAQARSGGHGGGTVIGSGGWPRPSPPISPNCTLPPPPACATPVLPPPPPPPPPKPRVCPTPTLHPPPPPPPPSCPPPPPPPQCQPPPPPPTCISKRLEIVYPKIQKLKKKIINDPKGITKTWVGSDVCKYTGLVCDIVPDYNQTALAGADFNGFMLSGKNLDIAGFLDELPDIVFFHANSNNFTGTLPPKIKTLRYFYELDLSNNNYTGPFPQEVLEATKLTFLDLRFNQFVGTIPPQLFTLDVDVIFINNNMFTGNLPDNFGSTPARYLTFANNKFTGSIPKSIGRTANTLLEVLFLNNDLSGCLPYEIGLLKKATVFDAETNQLTGPIPRSFACLEKIQFLNLARNRLYGPVPELVCMLPNLVNLSLSCNYFTQVGPECRKLIKEGVLDVNMNCIRDIPNQRSPGECEKFFSEPQYCPELRYSKYVPCDKGHLTSNNGKVDRSVIDISKSRTYGALAPHQNRP